MTSPTYGIQFNIQDTDPRPAQSSDMSVIGLVLPSDDADPTFLPYNTPVAFDSSDAVALTKIGTDDIYKAILMIDDQLGDWQTSARVVVSRVPRGGNRNETIANIVGDRASATGLYSLLQAGPTLGVIPRMIGAPGFTGDFTRVSGATGATSAAKNGGNHGNGVLTLASPAALSGSQQGVYVVRCVGGTTSVTSAPKTGGNTGNGTMGSLTSDADAMLGVWRVICVQAAADGGFFEVVRPDGTFDGIAAVGTAYNAAHGPNFTISDGSSDFIVGDEFDITVVAAVPANGGVFSVTDPYGRALPNATVGVAYSTQIGFTIADGLTDFIIGDGFDLTVTVTGGIAQANPIVAALPEVLSALLGTAVVGSNGISQQDDMDWRGTISDPRIIPVDSWVSRFLPDGTSEYQDGAAIAMGLFVRVDYQHMGLPFWSISGQMINNILGLKNYYTFSLTDGATQAQELLANQISVIERGELNVETAAAGSGFVWLGVWNGSTDPLQWFYNKRRGRDWTHLALLKSIRLRLGVENVTPHGVQAVLNDMTSVGSYLINRGAVVGFKVGFEAASNSVDDLRQGKFRVVYAQEEPAPIVQVTIDSRPFQQALEVELATIVSQADSLTPQFLT